MAVPRFFHPRFSEGSVSLSTEESAHARLSRRLRTRDEVELFDGAGCRARAVIVSVPRAGSVCVEVTQVSEVARSDPRLILATALPKGARQDLLIEKCTEVGVDVVRPVLFQRAVVRPADAKQSKWRRTAIEAAKQCGRSWLPTFEPPVSFSEWMTNRDSDEMTYVAHRMPPGEVVANSLLTQLQHDTPAKAVCVVIGPEGGFTDSEIEAMQTAGIKAVSLGPNVLRIETAAIVATAMIRAWAEGQIAHS